MSDMLLPGGPGERRGERDGRPGYMQAVGTRGARGAIVIALAVIAGVVLLQVVDKGSPGGGSGASTPTVVTNATNGSTTTTTINGVMHADGRVEGEVVLTHNGSVQSIASTNGTGMRTVPFVNEKGDVPLSEEARDALSGPAKACKTGLGLVRGVSG